ncbi:MAG: TnsA endonuclease N-terminal domain-containing protein [Succinivibrionaceae bacterium]|nr:TnsA endonuclease N-terminal domain-containing protein [Succinivibrionaceae bacterium]
MGRKRNPWTLDQYRQQISLGAGQGDLENYEPWPVATTLSQMDKMHDVQGRTTGRLHSFLLSLQKTFCLILDFDPDVKDIKEYWPLPLDETAAIAQEINVSHPTDNGYPTVLLADFYYLKNGSWHAMLVKRLKQLESEGMEDSIAIMQEYFRRHGQDLGILTEKELNSTIVYNYNWLTEGEYLADTFPDPEELESVISMVKEASGNLGIAADFSTFVLAGDEHLGLPEGTIMQTLKYMALNRMIKVNMNQKINFWDLNPTPREVLMANFRKMMRF